MNNHRPNRGFKNRDNRPKSLFRAPLAAIPTIPQNIFPTADLSKAVEQSIPTIDCGTFDATPPVLDAAAFSNLSLGDRVMWIELLSLIDKVNRHLAKMDQKPAIRGAMDGIKGVPVGVKQ